MVYYLFYSIKGILQTQPVSASCILGDTKLICIFEKITNQESPINNEYDVPQNFNIVIDNEESSFKNFSKKNLEIFAYKLFEYK